MQKNLNKFFGVLFLLLMCLQVLAQTKNKVEILAAQNFEFIKTGDKNISKLIGNVQLKQQNTLMYCDSALIYESENVVEAFSHVKINHNDSVTITGDYLLYDGNTKKALIKGNVVLVDKEMTLTTEQLDYDLANQFGYYDLGGKIVSKENVLTSRIGYYYARKNEFFFKQKVYLNNPNYVMVSDTLLYHTLKKTAYFFGSTQITSDKDKIICENGWYNTQTDQSQFSKNAIIFTDRKMLKADSLFYDRKAKLGKAFRRIHVYDSVQKLHLFGNTGISNGRTKITYVNGESYALKLMEKGDSLFLFSDTLLVAEKLGMQKQLFKAYHQVRIFKSDMQAVCDSLVYIQEDSLMQLFKAPVMWSGVNQITSDTILFYINNGKLDSFNLLNNAMIISKEKGAHYNQIKGKNMSGAMDSSQLKDLLVFGNGQSIFYAKEDSLHYIGVNVIDCSEMNFEFMKGQIHKATFISSPDATLYPLDELKPEELRLKGFKWREALRPKRF
ncbi:MAG: OstA-like protein [Bacteroidota bacterium]|nr:OstA-like protein [Bacteroidota bacterium]